MQLLAFLAKVSLRQPAKPVYGFVFGKTSGVFQLVKYHNQVFHVDGLFRFEMFPSVLKLILKDRK
jgi:hypothetical protein